MADRRPVAPAAIRRQFRRYVVFVLAAAALVGAAALISPRLKSPQQAAADAAPPNALPITASVERKALSEAVVLRGEIVAGKSVKLASSASASGPDSVITSVAVKRGDKLGEGRVIADCAGKPMVTAVLPFPLYRDIRGGMSGPDVREVQKWLRRLGYATPVSGTLDSGTQDSLRRFWSARGQQNPVEPQTAQAVAEAQVNLKRARDARKHAVGPQEVEAASTDVRMWEKRLASAQLQVGPGVNRAQVVRLDRSGRRITAIRVKIGDVLTDSKVLVELDGEPPTVTVSVSSEQRSLVAVGQKAVVVDELTGRKAGAELAWIGEEPTADRSGAAGFPGRFVFLGDPLSVTTGRSVRVDLASTQSGGPVLAVPLSAVYSRPDGSTYVTVRQAGGQFVDGDVTAGATAGGWVEVTPSDGDLLTEGSKVVVGGFVEGGGRR